MIQTKSIDRSYNYAISQIFGSSLLNKIGDDTHEQNFKYLLTTCELYPAKKKWDFAYGLELAYNYLKNNYRCEYVYKNEIANQLLLKYHSDNSATLLKEVASDNSIADIVIINGDTVAYEIKTELDNFDRLCSQLPSYENLYDLLYIVTYRGAVEKLESLLAPSIGIIILDDDGILKTVKPAENNSSMFMPEKAVFSLRQSELVAAYERLEGKFPKMGTALIFEFCSIWYLSLEKKHAHKIFGEALKSRKPTSHQFELIKHGNPGLKMLLLSKPLSKKNCISIKNKLSIFV